MDKKKLIYCKEEDVPTTKTRKEFLTKYLEGSFKTYNYQGNVECKANSKRSVSDLHKLVMSRFPNTSINAVIRILAELNKDNVLALVWCTIIKKVVVMTKKHNHFLKTNEFVTSYSKNNYYTTLGVDEYDLKLIDEIGKDELKRK